MVTKENRHTHLKRVFLLLAGSWSVVIILFLIFIYLNERKSIFDIAINECRTDFQKDVQYRLWATMHGGVYVPQTEDTPPNPYLNNVLERDIVTPSGKKLTLINPAYMTRQVFKLGRDRFNFIGHITSLNPIRKENGADEWEKTALTSFEKGNKETIEIVDYEGAPHVRFMAPFITEKGCLKCHANQGYKVGDIRGGISITIPWKPFSSLMWEEIQSVVFGSLLVWLVGLTGLFAAYINMKKNYVQLGHLNEKLTVSENLVSSLLNAIKESVLLIDTTGIVLAANETVINRLDKGGKDFVGKNVFEFFPKDVADFRRKKLEQVINSRSQVNFVDVRLNKTIDNYLTPIFDETGNVSQIALIGIDISERELAVKELRENEERFRRISDTISDISYSCVLGKDGNSKLNWLYGAVEAITGYSENELYQMECWGKIVLKEDFHIFKKHVLEVPPGSTDICQLRVRKKDGSVVWIQASAQCSLSDDLEKNSVLFGSMLDITERKTTELELEKHKDHLEMLVEERTEEIDAINRQLIYEVELKTNAEKMLVESLEKEKELNQLKSRFISTASHEFKTPLTAVLSSAELLERYGSTWNDLKRNSHLDRIKKSVQHLVELINEVLSVSKAGSGKIDFMPAPLDLKEFCENIIEEAKLSGSEKHKFVLDYSVDMKTFNLDAKHINTVLQNLISNAAKYSPQGGTVELKLAIQQSSLIFSVSDEGIGMPANEMHNIFQPFFRFANVGEISGTGLGLTIVKNSVEAHGGKISVNSVQGQGSVFTVEIPISL